jgi:hypothetical protein
MDWLKLENGVAMSAISGSGSGNQQAILQYIQGLQQSQSSKQSTLLKSSSSNSNDPSSTIQSLFGGHHRHGGGKGGGKSGGASAFFSQIQSAVTSALQSAQSSGSSSDPNKVIESAIAQVFKNQQNITGGSSSQASASGSSSQGSGQTNASSSTTQSAFAQLLQANGVDPEQFHSDFLAAIQSAQSGGTLSASSVFASVPTGSVVDEIA